MFWGLARTADYRVEVYKIVNEVAVWLAQDHIDFIFKQIRQIPAEKISTEEFQCLSELGKYSKEPSFKRAITDFFWEIVCNSDAFKEDLVNSCITKFCEMVKYWDVSIKHEFFLGLAKNLEAGKSSISTIRLFKTLIKDQKDRITYSYNSSPVKVGEQGDSVPEEFTLNTSLGKLIKEVGLTSILLANLANYQA